MFDLSAITENTTAEVELVHPVTKAPLGAAVTIAGPEHPKRKSILHDRQRKMRAKFQRSGKITLNDPADDDTDEIDYLAACTLGWRGIKENGQEVAYSQQEAAKLYARPELAWLRTQVRAAMDDQELFIATSAPG